ncbi:MAG: glycosyltransferase family 39 protein [Gammaproteobacteria bacterium]|nr:MAG: glycosyltransferase family 39 protein [Gammaproteobacteria bacterium]
MLATRFGLTVSLLLLWLSLLLVTLLGRPLLPVDETRYVAVAWEMWQRGDFLVPYLNGEPYSHKPPLFFWLIQAGWWLFGINAWWPHCVGALASLAALFLTMVLARQLWPADTTTARLVPWVLFAMIFWTAFYSWVQIDMLLVLACVLGMIGMVGAAQGRAGGWLLTGVAIGLGVLTKGPVMLVFVLPVALLGPLWIDARLRRPWLSWYGGVALSVFIGACIGLGWALPAAQAGGEAYREALLWGQTAERLMQSFAHAHPWWWYLPWLPLLLVPWLLLPWLWPRLVAAVHRPDAGVRFCLCVLVPALVLLSLISGKQAKYLLPLLPAAALLIARAVSGLAGQPVTQRPWLLAAALFLAGAALVVVPFYPGIAPWLADIHPAWGAGIMVIAVVLVLLGPLRTDHYPPVLALCSVLVTGLFQAGVFRAGVPSYDLQAVSRLVATVQAAGWPVANLASYHGQFHFYGRLTRPIISLPEGAAVAWARDHPDGLLVAYDDPAGSDHPTAEYVQPYRGGSLVVWSGASVAANPDVLP